MQEKVRKDFLPLVSKTWEFITWLTRISGMLLLLVAFLLLLGWPAAFFNRPALFIVVAILYYPALAFGVYRFFIYQKKIRKRTVLKIIVDAQGIHYERKDGSVDEILYSNLKSYSFSDEYDVSVSPVNKAYVLQIYENDKVKEVDFIGRDAGYTSCIGNLKALRRKYIQGITCFRPDLRINPLVYEVFYINPVDFIFDHKKFWTSLAQTFAIMVLCCLVLATLMLVLVKWLF